jgi:hypothetical protein
MILYSLTTFVCKDLPTQVEPAHGFSLACLAARVRVDRRVLIMIPSIKPRLENVDFPRELVRVLMVLDR